MFIKPQGFDEMHDRHGMQHRLKDEKKWQPLGIGVASRPNQIRNKARQVSANFAQPIESQGENHG